MEYIIQFFETESSSVRDMKVRLTRQGIKINERWGVRRPTRGVAQIVAHLYTQEEWDFVHRLPDVVAEPKIVAETPDPLSGCCDTEVDEDD